MVDYDKSWDSWADNRIYGATPRHLRKMIGGLIDGLEYDSVLDIGCGSGSFLKFIKRRSKAPISGIAGIDLSAKAVEISKVEIPEGSFSVLDIEKEYLRDKYDLVICNDVLEHLADDAGALDNIRRMSKKYFICNTVQGKMHESERLIGHVRNYRKEDLITKLKKAGFDIIEVIEWGFPFYDLARRMSLSSTQKFIYGRYGFFKKIMLQIVYFLFMLNSKKRGDLLIILSKAGG